MNNYSNKLWNFSTTIKFFVDLSLWTLAGLVAFWLRLDNQAGKYQDAMRGFVFAQVVLASMLIFIFSLNRQVWSRIGTRDLVNLAKAVGIGMLALTTVIFLRGEAVGMPRSIPLISSILAFLMMGGVRLFSRFYFERIRLERRTSITRVLIAGAGEAGVMIAKELLRHPESGLEPVGFLDDDRVKQRQILSGIPVLGMLDDIDRIAQSAAADEILIAIPSASGATIRTIVEKANIAKVKYRIIPGVFEILSGKVGISQLRNVDLEDLLRRDAVKLETQNIEAYLANRTILVTGAGGSIGSELVRQVSVFCPKKVVLFGRGENSLYLIAQELSTNWPEIDFSTVVGDVRDAAKLDGVFEQFQPEVVFHAAAHKHVPLMEENPDEAVINNVLGTKNVVDMCLKYGTSRLVNISTDKAVNPTSIMGTSKRVAEYMVGWGSVKSAPEQSFVSVRFGNVLGSRGSVVPLFKKQIEKGGPITVTHPDMTRFFMTIPEASQLVLQAGALGENGAVYVLDMGQPVRIVDLARDLIKLSGLEPDIDIKIEFSGIRTGEKLYEEILTAEEGTVSSRHEKIFVAKQTPLDPRFLEQKLDGLVIAARTRNKESIKRAFKELVPSYQGVKA